MVVVDGGGGGEVVEVEVELGSGFFSVTSFVASSSLIASVETGAAAVVVVCASFTTTVGICSGLASVFSAGDSITIDFVFSSYLTSVVSLELDSGAELDGAAVVVVVDVVVVVVGATLEIGVSLLLASSWSSKVSSAGSF